jgi:hypothetical protein
LHRQAGRKRCWRWQLPPERTDLSSLSYAEQRARELEEAQKKSDRWVRELIEKYGPKNE